MWHLRGAARSAIVTFAAIVGAEAQTLEKAAPPASETKPHVASQAAVQPSHSMPATANPPTADGKTPTSAVVVGLDTLEGVSGKAVRSETGEDMGRITDMLVGANGEPRAAVIDFGGFLGVGSRKVAVDWKTLNFSDSIKSGSVKVSLTRDQVRQSPEYKSSEPVVILETSRPSQPGPATSAPDAAPGR